MKTIAERPAWPRHIHFVEAIPLTTVGKIYKPQLRCDAAARLVNRIVCEQLALSEAMVHVREGDRRGMTVSVRLPQAQQALSAFLFEVVKCSSGAAGAVTAITNGSA